MFAYDAPVAPTTKLFVSKQFSQLKRNLFIIIIIIILIIIIIITTIINTKNVLITFIAAIRLE